MWVCEDMMDDVEFQELMQKIVEQSLQIINKFEFKPDAFNAFLEKWTDIVSDFQAFIRLIAQHPQLLLERHNVYLQEATSLLKEHLTHGQAPTLIHDKRFATEAWAQHPYFLMISQHYLLLKTHVGGFFDSIEFADAEELKRIRFLCNQLLDALSPEHFLWSNPQLVKDTIQSQGKNILRGFHNMLADIDKGSGRWVMSMTDKSAFRVGENIGATPGKVVFRNELIELIQYMPQTKHVRSIPILLIPPWINKYYILDLSAHNSLVRWLVEQGMIVFIISWRNPDKHQAHFGIAEYLIQGPVAAITAIQTQLQVETVSALGFCIGGTLLSILLAYYKARQINVISSATFLASLVDFSDPGDIGVYLNEKQIIAIEKRMKQQGYLEGELMAMAFNSLRATELIWSFFIKHYLQGQAPVPFDLLFWNTDTTNMPEKMHSEYLRWMYLNNDLVKPGKIVIDGTPIDVRSIELPLFFLSTQKDHIAPWKSTYQGFKLMRGKKRFVLGGSGHIAGIVIPPGKEKYGYYTNPLHPKDPDIWLQKAQYSSGSWWPEWLKWLKRHSGAIRLAPGFETLPLPPIMEAPGTYVYGDYRVDSKSE